MNGNAIVRLRKAKLEPCLYNDLGVSERATEEEILAKFEAHKQAFEVYKKAFEVLGDDKKKEQYDRKIAEERQRVK